MQKITPHLWFDKEAPEAGAFHTSVFGSPVAPDLKKLDLAKLKEAFAAN